MAQAKYPPPSMKNYETCSQLLLRVTIYEHCMEVVPPSGYLRNLCHLFL